MVGLDKSGRDKILEDIRMARERRQQALNYKRAQLRILPQEIDAIKKEIDDLDKAKAYLEKS